tara:strand:- start:1660 stop:2058 length:399 start_codon:yes stop_codon:yes gene_type:complete
MSMNHALSEFLAEEFSNKMRYTKADFVGMALSEASAQDSMELAIKILGASEETDLGKFEQLKTEIGVCALKIVEHFASNNYSSQWGKTEEQDYKSPLRLISDNPNQEHIDAANKESGRDFARAHGDVLGARK